MSLSSLPLTYLIFVPVFLLFVCLKPLRELCMRILGWFEEGKRGLLFLMFVTTLIALFSINRGNGWGDDSSQYVSQAKALVDGNMPRWLELNQYAIDHTKFGYAPLVYPWGLPILLSPLYKLFGIQFYAFKFFEVICFVCAVYLIYRLFTRRFSNQLALVLALLFALNYNYIHEVDDVYADIPAMLFSFLSLYMIDCFKKEEKLSIPQAILIGLSIFMAIALRTTSIAVLVALFVYDALHVWKHHKQKEPIGWVGMLLPYILAIGGYLILSYALPSSGAEYGSFFQFSAQLIGTNIIRYYQYVGQLLGDLVAIYPDKRILFYAIVFVFLALMVVGQLKQRKEELLLNVYLFVSICVLIVFYGTSIRYLFPIYPIGLLFVGYGYLYTKERFPRWFRTILVGGAIAILAIHVACDVVYIAGAKLGFRQTNFAYTDEAVEVYKIVEDTVEEDKNVFFFKPRALLLNADVHTFGHDETDYWKEADYLLVAKEDPLRETINGYAVEKGHQLLFENTQFMFWKKK